MGIEMRKRNRSRRKGKGRRAQRGQRIFFLMVAVFAAVLLTGAVIYGIWYFDKERGWKKPPELLAEYMEYASCGEYEKMYNMLDVELSGNVQLEDFVKRNSAIYEGIEMRDLKIDEVEYDEDQLTVKYHSSCETVAGNNDF